MRRSDTRGDTLKIGNEGVCLRSTKPCDQIVARGGGVMAAAALSNIMELRCINRMAAAQQTIKSIQRARATEGRRPPLIGDGDQGRPLGCPGAGPAVLPPAEPPNIGIVNRETAVGVRVVGHIGVGAVTATLRYIDLITGLGLESTDATTAAAPAKFTEVIAGGIDAECRAANGEDVR